MSDLDYVYAVARIRVKEKMLLSDADVSQMAGMKDEEEVMGFLSQKGWGDTSEKEDTEKFLEKEKDKTWALMKELKIDPSVFSVLAYPNLYHNLKAGIKTICTAIDYEGIFYENTEYDKKRMLEILKEKNYKALPKHMENVAAEAMDVMLKTRDGQKCDILVDRACLMAMQKAVRNVKSPLIRSYVKSTVAVANIRIAARAQKTGKNIRFLQEALAPCEALDVNALAMAAAGEKEALLTYLDGHGFHEAAEALRESSSAFERWCDNRLIEEIQPEKRNSFSIGPVVAYYLARENEIKTVRIILTAKNNGFSEEETRERVRKMYV